jgi:hypothetical protein
LGIWNHQLFADQSRNADSADTFRKVGEEDSVAITFAQDPRNISRPNIAATHRPDVDPGEPASQISGRNGTDEVTDERGKEKSGQRNFRPFKTKASTYQRLVYCISYS